MLKKDKTRIYWDKETQSYTEEFPNKEDRVVYLMLDQGLTLREAWATQKALQDQLKGMEAKGVKRGLRPLRKALAKLEESIYVSQRY